MADAKVFDLLVIGGGPAGYVGAIRAAQLDMSVACIERDKLGGVCLNWGCIPTKNLLTNAQHYRWLKHEAADWGVNASDISHDWSKVIGRSRSTADTLNRGIQGLFKKHKIQHFQGHARITAAPEQGPITVEVHDAPDHVSHTIQARRVLIATGARPRELPGVPFDGERVIRSREAMSLDTQPQKLLIVGAGAIGMEFAYFYNAFGTEVTVVEMLDRLLPLEDEEVSQAIGKAFRKQKVTALTGYKTLSVEHTDSGIRATVAPVDDESNTQQIEADKVLIAIGVQGNLEGLIADDLQGKFDIDRGHVVVDKTDYRTSLPNVYATGDVIGPPWLAHVAMEEAVICIERMAGLTPHGIDYHAIPACTYCVPQVASLGKSEQALREQGMVKDQDYQVGKFPFQASGKAQAAGHTEGFVKLITSLPHGELLGAHMVGDSVTELLAQLGVARQVEATHDDLIATMFAHPTLSEAIHEAALGTQDRMLHL